MLWLYTGSGTDRDMSSILSWLCHIVPCPPQLLLSGGCGDPNQHPVCCLPILAEHCAHLHLWVITRTLSTPSTGVTLLFPLWLGDTQARGDMHVLLPMDAVQSHHGHLMQNLFLIWQRPNMEA